IFAIQDEIAEAILNATKIRLFGEDKEALSQTYSDNIEAYDLYLKGRYHMHKFTPDGLFRAIDYYDAAIALEPNFAIAYAGLTMCYTSLKDFNWTTDMEAIPKAKKAANKSLELDDTISESHMAVGRILLHQEWRIQNALVQYKKALSINPNSADCHSQIGMCLVLLGHTEEALVHAETAIRLDPFSILNLWISTPAYSCAGDHQTVIANGRRILELDPNMPTGHMWIGLGHVGLKEYDRAITALQTMVKLNPGPYSLSLLGLTYGLMGEKEKAEEIIERIEAYEVVKTAGNFFAGNVYASIGKADAAFRYFERAVENHEGHVLWIQFYVLRYMPELLRDVRTKKLFDKIGLPHIEW
ncbi:MAG: tetratricopeptide repeat protein, partial [Robiginitalea sp.]